jgi:hypothetical protein
MLVGKFLKHFSATTGVCAIVFDDNLYGAAVDAACVIDALDGGIGGGTVPAAIGGTDTGCVFLKADLDRSRALRLGKAHGAGQYARRSKRTRTGTHTQQGRATADF